MMEQRTFRSVPVRHSVSSQSGRRSDSYQDMAACPATPRHVRPAGRQVAEKTTGRTQPVSEGPWARPAAPGNILPGTRTGRHAVLRAKSPDPHRSIVKGRITAPMTITYRTAFRLTVVTRSTSRSAKSLLSNPPKLTRLAAGKSRLARYSAEKIAF